MQVSIVSVVYSQSELLQKEVFLVELIESISMSRESMSHLKAVYFLRPTSENIKKLRRQLASPRFGEYHLCKYLVLMGNLNYKHTILPWKLFNFLGILLPTVTHFLNPFLMPYWIYSFLQHIEGYSNS